MLNSRRPIVDIILYNDLFWLLEKKKKKKKKTNKYPYNSDRGFIVKTFLMTITVSDRWASKVVSNN